MLPIAFYFFTLAIRKFEMTYIMNYMTQSYYVIMNQSQNYQAYTLCPRQSLFASIGQVLNHWTM